MNKCFIVLLILSFHFSQGQQVKFQIKRTNPCDTVGKIDSTYYYLSDSKDSLYHSELGTVALPDTGTYNVHFLTYRDLPISPINIPDTGLTVFTWYEPKIVLRAYGMHPRSVYESCGILINGYDEDYYDNGKIRIRGNFRDGKPEDSLVTFYANGVTKRRLRYLPKETIIEEYDSLSNLTSVSYNSNKSYYLTDYKTTEYYLNGRVRRQELSIDKLVLIEEYYPDGQKKVIQTDKRRTEYHQNGSLNIIYTWKRKKQKVIPGEYNFDFVVTKKTFNEAGALLEMQVYDYWGLYQPQPRLEFSQSDWINKWSKWKDGKEIIVAENVKTKEYFDKHSE
jgi:hypothetical protein